MLVDNGDRLGQVHEDRLQATLDAAHLRIQTRIVDRQRRTPRELADELQILLAIGRAVAQAQDRKRSERALAREQRRDHRRAVTVLDHELGVLGALREGAQQRARHLGQQHRLSTAQNLGDGMSSVGVERVLDAQLFELPGKLRLARMRPPPL